LRRYWIDSQALQGQLVQLDGDVFHHICVVCRQALADRFEVLSEGKALFVEIIEVGKKRALAKVLNSREIPPPPVPRLELCLSLPKLATFEKVLEKAVELGVARLHPFTSDFCSMKMGAQEWASKLPRWERIITSATQQTGRGDRMQLTGLRPLSVLLAEQSQQARSRALLAYEGETHQPLRAQLALAPGTDLESLWVFVGSEGGFSPGDIKLFKSFSILPLGLGDQVLRVETACVTLLAILKYELGHFG
jgi:16S rRNA (uracil1498-N3)-methyltransferase